MRGALQCFPAAQAVMHEVSRRVSGKGDRWAIPKEVAGGRDRDVAPAC